MKNVVRALCVHQTQTLGWDVVTNFDRLESEEQREREGSYI